MQQQDNLHTIQSSDINAQVKDLPTLQVHIRDETPKIQADIKHIPDYDHAEYVRINQKKNLDEAKVYEPEHIAEVDRIARSLDGTDYHADLQKLHSNVPAYVPEGKSSNAVDNYIHDVLKRGRPSGAVVAHLHDVMHTEDHEIDHRDNRDNQKYLDHKWSPFLAKHAAEQQSIKYPHEAAYTRDELNKIPANFSPVGLRLLSHSPSGHIYEYHPTEGLKFISHYKNAVYNKDLEEPNKFKELSDTLNEHYEPFESKHITEYSSDSSPMNRYHFLDHAGLIDADTEHIKGQHIDRIKETSTGVSNHFKATPHPTHLPEFHVYTGLFGSNNPHTQATHRDESGKLLFHVPAFTSTSLDMGVAREFAKKKQDGTLNREFTDVLKIKLPGGYHHGAFIKPHSEHEEEEEFLLDKAHTFKLHPEPTYHVHNRRIVRVWDTELHHKESDLSKPLHELSSRTEKLDRLMHPDVSEQDVGVAQYDADTSVRAAAAKHPKVSLIGLDFLTKDRSHKVRAAAMLNPNLSHKQMYSSLSDIESAKSLAGRSDIPPHVTHALVNHASQEVKYVVAKRHDLSSDEIGHLINNGTDSVMQSLAGNESLHPDLLHEFRNHSNRNVRRALANNPSAKEVTLRHMLYDESSTVGLAAGDNLKRKAGVVKQ